MIIVRGFFCYLDVFSVRDCTWVVCVYNCFFYHVMFMMLSSLVTHMHHYFGQKTALLSMGITWVKWGFTPLQKLYSKYAAIARHQSNKFSTKTGYCQMKQSGTWTIKNRILHQKCDLKIPRYAFSKILCFVSSLSKKSPPFHSFACPTFSGNECWNTVLEITEGIDTSLISL